MLTNVKRLQDLDALLYNMMEALYERCPVAFNVIPPSEGNEAVFIIKK